jgi:hypothetical protein
MSAAAIRAATAVFANLRFKIDLLSFLHSSNLAGFYEQRPSSFDTVHPVLKHREGIVDSA